jgi:hypothetical protein
MSLSIFLSKIEPMVLDLEKNYNQINHHRNVANLAKTASIFTYLFTNDSKNTTVKTIGQVATVGGLVYGYSQNSKASTIEQNNIIILESIISNYEISGISNVRTELDTNLKIKFLELILRANRYSDLLTSSYLSKINSKGLLGTQNQTLFLNVISLDIFNQKLRILNIFKTIDSSKRFPQLEYEYKQNIAVIDTVKLKNEGIAARTIIIALIALGILISSSNVLGTYFIIAGFLFWGINHYFPLFNETKKIRNAFKILSNNFKVTLGITNLTFQ